MQLSEGSLITIGLFLVAQIGGFIYVFATITEKLRVVGDNVNKIDLKLVTMDLMFVKEKDLARELENRDIKIEAIFKKLDKIG